jgi:hypothetical protein
MCQGSVQSFSHIKCAKNSVRYYLTGPTLLEMYGKRTHSDAIATVHANTAGRDIW